MAVDYRSYPVLFVDDEPANLITIRYVLDEAFTLYTATGGEEALRILAERDVAVLLADQRMPGMSGAELCARARDLKPNTIRMIVTAYADLHAAIDAINRGQVTRYLTKPWRNDELIEVLRTAIEIVHIERTVREMEFRLLGSQRATAYTLQAEFVHELSSPLHALELNLDAASDLMAAAQRSARDPTRLETVLQELGSAQIDAHAAAKSVRAILERVRQTGQMVVGRREASDVARVVDSTVRIVRSEVERVGRLQVTVEHSPSVAFESSALGQVLLNLLLNAAQAMTAGVASNLITVRVSAAGRFALVSVADTGPGIAQEFHERIFDPQFTTKATGSGLGLAIVRNLVESAGGSVTLESHPEKGATFTVRLPLAATP